MSRDEETTVPGLWLVVAAVLLALAASLFMLFGLSVTTETGVATVGAGGGESSVSRASRDAIPVTFESLLLFGVPVVFAAAPLLALHRRKLALGLRIASTGLLFLWVVVLAFGGGIFYLPTAVAMGVAAALAAGIDDSSVDPPHRATARS